MKRKLFTLLLAFLAVAGFQARAQLVTVATGDSTAVSYGKGAGSLENERGGYAGKLLSTPNHLTVEGGKFVYKKGPAKTTLPTKDRITVSNPAVNFVVFNQGDDLLELNYKGVDYSQFVVFTSGTNTQHVNWLATGSYNACGGNTDVSQVLTSAPYNGGEFEGFLAVQATGYVDACDLLIVVHDTKGALSLMAYKEYVAIYASNGVQTSDLKDATKPQYYPLYVKTNKLSGRWARPEDFADCNFNRFYYPGTTTDPNPEELTVYPATEVRAKTKVTPHTVFAVTQVDYVKDGDVLTTNNIITHTGGAKFQGLDKDAGSSNSAYYGTARSNSGTLALDSVIPLFTLATPENNCQVLSVSRCNDLETQSEQDGGYANKLEIRDYGTYYKYVSAAKPYEKQIMTPATTHGSPADITFDTYTSLQKFAIWIDAEGNFILYPAASYIWQYGNPKDPQPDNIRPNAVLVYNDIHVKYTAGITPIGQADKAYGVQIGWWNGYRTQGGNVTPYIGTIPNSPLQAITDYKVRPFIGYPECDDANLEGRFYFLQVYPDTVGAWKTSDAFKKDQYQFKREYVLSVQVDPVTSTKHLVAVPKEEMRATSEYAGEYWRFPYDSVNMAAHWEVKAVKNTDGSIHGYRLINMLGDTLQYDVTSPTVTSSPNLVGGYLQYNGDWAGKAGTATSEKYLGRPTDADPTKPWTTVTHWFDLNSIASDFTTPTTYNVWKFNQLKAPYHFGKNDDGQPYGQKSFFMELLDHGQAAKIGLAFGSKGWYNLPGYSVGSGPAAGPLLPGKTYWQQDVNLDVRNTENLASYPDFSFPNCFGLLISMEEIPYVPKFGPFYPGEKENNVINTNDKDFQKQDSLTAYTFLEGRYDLTEAREVGTQLKLGAAVVDINDGLGRTANVARLLNTTEKEILEFIPLNSALGNDRKALIKSCAPTGTYGIDTLYGETYKWYLVKLGDKYLTFDTVNVAARTNREKVGLVFDALLENAMPVRLYQPLVGDKQNNNFLFQFYLPKNTYYPALTGKKFYANKFPAIESTNLSGQINGGLEVCFATLSNESNYIYATKARTGLTSGTRFHIVDNEPVECPCPAEFIDPKWMADNRLLSLPLNNRIWVQQDAVQAWLATGLTSKAPEFTIPGNSAIVTNEGADKATTLTHTYVTTIKDYTSATTYAEATAKVPIPHGTAKGDTVWVKDFQKDLDVPLYYVQNDAGLYLTVMPKSDMRDSKATTADVNGIKLEWQPKINYNKAQSDAKGYDDQVRQLFAISGCKEVNDKWYGNNFIYLPLASYQIDYVTGDIITVPGKTEYAISYNKNLGKESKINCAGNDVTDCYRISQYSSVTSTVKDLVVFNSSSTAGLGSLVPVEFRLSKQGYVKEFCDFQLVQNTNNYGADKGKYYSFDNKISIADNDWAKTNRLNAHWKIVWDADDEYLATFKPELEKMYGTATVQTQLKGQYYFIKKLAGTIDNHKTGSVQVRVLDVSGYGSSDFTAKFDTLTLTCVEHTVPFFDLEEDGKFNIDAVKLAILEAPFVDRNLTDNVQGDLTTPTPIFRGGSAIPIAWQSYIARTGEGYNKQNEYLTIYRENQRELTPHHIIPYYSFSITRNGVEYFLNVDSWSGNDSVYWTALTDTEKGVLVDDYIDNPNAMKQYKFCLPYKVDEDGNKVAEVNYGDATYPPVYLQTLDVSKTDSPYLIIAGASTKYVTARKLDTALKPGTSSTLDWNIYTVDYRHIDLMKVTAWIFGGEIGVENVWVPLLGDNGQAGTVDGVLTNQHLAGGGVTFITESKETPVNYGILNTVSANNLHFEFEGDTTIGAWAVRPIWYYRIQLGSEDKFLTDATVKAKTDTKYEYAFGPGTYPYGYFETKLANEPTYKIKADKDFVQTFGFKYVNPDKDVQSFYIVSNANYTTPKVDQYRYLADVNNRLVFVSNPTDAMVFQFGKIGSDGKYTDLEVVGQGGIFGVTGGVKLLNTTGKVDIYSIDGRLVKSALLTGSEEFVAAPRGVVLVKNGSKVVKVVVK
jgi:hypothetical protein